MVTQKERLLRRCFATFTCAKPACMPNSVVLQCNKKAPKCLWIVDWAYQSHRNKRNTFERAFYLKGLPVCRSGNESTIPQGLFATRLLNRSRHYRLDRRVARVADIRAGNIHIRSGMCNRILNGRSTIESESGAWDNKHVAFAVAWDCWWT